MQWTVNGPDAVYSDTEAACAWLGVSESRFRRLVQKHGWVRPWNAGGAARPKYMWHWMDLVALAHLLQQQSAPAPDLDAEGEEADATGG